MTQILTLTPNHDRTRNPNPDTQAAVLHANAGAGPWSSPLLLQHRTLHRRGAARRLLVSLIARSTDGFRPSVFDVSPNNLSVCVSAPVCASVRLCVSVSVAVCLSVCLCVCVGRSHSSVTQPFCAEETVLIYLRSGSGARGRGEGQGWGGRRARASTCTWCRACTCTAAQPTPPSVGPSPRRRRRGRW